MQLLFIFAIGWLVSFLGQLPLGAVSFTSTQIAVQESYSNAWKFSLGVSIIEIIYLRLTLSGLNWILQHATLFQIIGWLTVAVFLILAVFSYKAAVNQKTEKKALILSNTIPRFLLGISMSALNPAQIPFWFIWSSYLISINVLHDNSSTYNWFTIGCGAGTITGLALYMYGGNWLISRMKTSNKTLNIIMGVIFLIAALAQLYRMIWNKGM